MSKQWVISDLHMGHKLMIEKEYRKVGFEEVIMKALNDCVGKNDTLYLLGDLAFGRQSYWCNRLGEIPCKTVLVKGNHDQNRDNWYRKRFDEVIPFTEPLFLDHEWGKVMLTHIPANPYVLSSYDERFKRLGNHFRKLYKENNCILNIHGHTHGEAQEKKYTYDATVDAQGLFPKTIDQILEEKFNESI